MHFKFFPEYCGGCILVNWDHVSSSKELAKAIKKAPLLYTDYDAGKDGCIVEYIKNTSGRIQVFFVLNENQKEHFSDEGINLKELLRATLLVENCNPNSGNMCYTYVTTIANLKEFIERYK